MEYDSNNPKNDIFSKKVRAGKRRTYFFDVRNTKSNDFYLTITESKKRHNEEVFDRHKIFIYKEDFNKFIGALQETIDYIKSDLLPEYDFEQFDKREDYDEHDDTHDDGRFNKPKEIKSPEVEDVQEKETDEEPEKEVVDEAETAVDDAPAEETVDLLEEKPKDELPEPSEEDLKWD